MLNKINYRIPVQSTQASITKEKKDDSSQTLKKVLSVAVPAVLVIGAAALAYHYSKSSTPFKSVDPKVLDPVVEVTDPVVETPVDIGVCDNPALNSDTCPVQSIYDQIFSSNNSLGKAVELPIVASSEIQINSLSNSSDLTGFVISTSATPTLNPAQSPITDSPIFVDLTGSGSSLSTTPTLNLTQPITDSTNSVNLPRPPTSPTRAPAPAPKPNQKPTNSFNLEGGQGSIVRVSPSNSVVDDDYVNEYGSPTNLKGSNPVRGMSNLGALPKGEPSTLNTIVDKLSAVVAGLGMLGLTTLMARARNGRFR